MDKPKTKRAPSPFILFCSDMRQVVKEKHPNATFGETGKLLGQMWASATERQKGEYVKKSAVLKESCVVNTGKETVFDKIQKIDSQIANLNKTKLKLVKSLKY